MVNYYNIIYQDQDILAVNKPAGITVFNEQPSLKKSLIDYLIADISELSSVGNAPRYGIVHRLDKETSGIVLVAKNEKTLLFLQKQFRNREVVKKYIALVCGKIKENQGKIETYIARASSGIKQKVYSPLDPEIKNKKKRKAITGWRVLKKYKEFTLIEAAPLTGRKHQIRTHLAYLGHPIAGDKLYAFKNQPCPEGLSRHFLHAGYLKIKLPDEQTKKFYSDLPKDLNEVLKKLKI
jgi:23S rRNA pseudouridine1911/1915/1917 synthase